MKRLNFGMTMFLVQILPTTYILNFLYLSKYGDIIKTIPSFIFTLVSFLIPYAIATIFIHKSDLLSRLPIIIPGLNLLILGGITIILHKALGMFDPKLTYILLADYFRILSLVINILMYVGIIKLLMAVKPNDSFIYK